MLEVSAFYFFKSLNNEDLQRLECALSPFKSRDVRGLILIGREGINATISGPAEAVASFKTIVQSFFGDVFFKDFKAELHPFREFKIRRRREIVTLGRTDLVPSGPDHHLTPAEWDEALKDPNTVVIDTRNKYEVEIGKFKNAIDLEIEEFREFPDRVRELNLSKDQKILIYCTGGIRCEKAILEMHDQGFENVFQLNGGIFEYLREFPNQQFEGECFVFDYRVAVDQQLQPSSIYRLCPHCGQPGTLKIECSKCDTLAVICERCSETTKTCSKNCAYHEEIQSASKRPHSQELAKRLPVK